ncbi:hypothetical protein, partial [Bacteroides thetaiotaomicron]
KEIKSIAFLIQYVKEHLILTFYTTSQKEGSCDTIVYQLSTSTRIPIVYLNKNTIVNFNNKA